MEFSLEYQISECQGPFNIDTYLYKPLSCE